MDNNKDYASDSDSSDEDFCPTEDNGKPESEESSDDEIEDYDAEDVEETQKPKKSKGKGTATKSRAATRKQYENETKRSTRHSIEAGKTVARETASQEKEELESDDDEKARADALWADFLGDVKQTPVEENKTESASKTSPSTNGNTPSINCTKISNGVSEAPKVVTVTEVLDFAGEEVRVQKTIIADSIKENKATTSNNPASGTSGLGPVSSLKRTAPSSSGGLGSLLNQIGKKTKISVLEKTKLDWNSFKQDEGIEEQLQTFNKGKDGFLERQDFLERTDLRQFEIERNLRQSRRNH